MEFSWIPTVFVPDSHGTLMERSVPLYHEGKHERATEVPLNKMKSMFG